MHNWLEGAVWITGSVYDFSDTYWVFFSGTPLGCYCTLISKTLTISLIGKKVQRWYIKQTTAAQDLKEGKTQNAK